jgi:signal transduction histidine kinase
MDDSPRQQESAPPGPSPGGSARATDDALTPPAVASDLDVLLTIGRALAGRFDLPDVLGMALAVAADVIGAEGASILLIDPDGGGMQFYVAEGPAAQAAKAVSVPPDAGICGHVAQTGRPLIVNDAQNDPRLYRAVDQATSVITRNLLCAPISSAQRLWGVLELINKTGGDGFDDHDLHLSEAVAAQTALALENAHLHGEIVRKERMAAVGQTVSGLAHCIKNILNGIRSGSVMVDRAMDQRDLDRAAEGWQTVQRNNEMLGTLVLDMLALARDSKPHPFPTDVNDLAEQVCGLMKGRAAEKRASVTCVPALGLPEIELDPTHFYRCLLNLVTNAVDACGEAGRVRVRVFRAKGRDRCSVSVTDDGEGISEENRRKLFAEFFTTKGGRGTGLGLPVTRKLIGEMGGTLTFHSVPGRGTRFVFTVPISAQTTQPQETHT